MIDPNKNCHEYCPVKKCCRYAQGENGLDYHECATYGILLNLLEEAKTARWQKKKDEMEDDDW